MKTHDGYERISTVEAFWILGYYWRVVLRLHGIGLPFAIAFWRYHNFGTTNWYPRDDRERTESLCSHLNEERTFDFHKGPTAGQRNFFCHRTQMVVYGVKDEDADHFNDWIEEPQVGVKETLDSYDFKGGPSKNGGLFGPLSRTDIMHFRSAISWYRTMTGEVKKEKKKETANA